MQKIKNIVFKKGSILVYSIIILAMMLVIAVGMSFVAITEKKSASTTDASAQSYQTADSGLQQAVNVFSSADSGKTLGEVFGADCSAGKISKTSASMGNYEISFSKMEDASSFVNDCDITKIAEIKNIKSVGTYNNTVRAVEVAVAASGNIDWNTTPTRYEVTMITNASITTPSSYSLCTLSEVLIGVNGGRCNVVRNANKTWTISRPAGNPECAMLCWN